MKNFKTILITILSVLIMIFISCRNDTTNPNHIINPNNPKVAFTCKDLVGTWYSPQSTNKIFIINGDGSVNYNSANGWQEKELKGWDKDIEIFEGEKYDLYIKNVSVVSNAGGGVATITLTFSSASNLTLSLLGQRQDMIKAIN